MLQHLTHLVLVVNFLTSGVFCADSDDMSVVLNITRPTRPPSPPPTGLFKYVQSCENFCDDQFPPGRLGVVASNGVIACHKGCYSFELFKVMRKSESFIMIDQICHANCHKDFGEETFDRTFCGMGCTKIHMLYRDRVQVLCKDLTSKLDKNKPQHFFTDAVFKYSEQAEKYLIERDLMIAEEIAVHVIVEDEKLHAVRYITPSGRSKSKIIHVERLWLSPEYHEYMNSKRKKLFEEAEARVPELKAPYNFDEIYQAERREWEKAYEPKEPQKLPKHIDNECLIFQIPIFFLAMFMFIIIIILWVAYGDLPECLFCFGKKFWEKLEYMDTYDMDEDDMVTSHDIIITKQMKEMNLAMSEGDQNYTRPPPEKDAPPPYVEININDPNIVDVRK